LARSEREGGRFEAAVAALGGTQDIRFQGSIITNRAVLRCFARKRPKASLPLSAEG
ncbi:MAG: hypothetical protein QOE07_2520, partial [Acidimicrobiaceae bacterium]|nr:hypothetical protein [Acidimicrobiaceae bacterium]